MVVGIHRLSLVLGSSDSIVRTLSGLWSALANNFGVGNFIQRLEYWSLSVCFEIWYSLCGSESAQFLTFCVWFSFP